MQYSLSAMYAFGARLRLLRQNSHRHKNNSASYTSYFRSLWGESKLNLNLSALKKIYGWCDNLTVFTDLMHVNKINANK